MDAGGTTTHRVTVAAADAGMRLDRVLAAALPQLSRSRLQRLIREGRVATDGGTITDPADSVKPGQSFTISVPPLVAAKPRGEAIPLDVVYEDAALIVIDKPAGLVVHPAPGNPDRTLVNARIAHCGASLSGIGGVRRPGIVHRLDKETSGLMVVAKTDAAHHALATQFKEHTIERAYIALCHGWVKAEPGVIEGAIGRHPQQRKKMAVVPRGGKPARTHYSVLRRFSRDATLTECRLETGRTHQIRVHMASIGHPLVGDPVYGRRQRRGRSAASPARAILDAFPRQALHARLIGFRHPESAEPLQFESELPGDLNRLLELLNAT